MCWKDGRRSDRIDLGGGHIEVVDAVLERPYRKPSTPASVLPMKVTIQVLLSVVEKLIEVGRLPYPALCRHLARRGGALFVTRWRW